MEHPLGTGHDRSIMKLSVHSIRHFLVFPKGTYVFSFSSFSMSLGPRPIELLPLGALPEVTESNKLNSNTSSAEAPAVGPAASIVGF